MRRRIVGVSAAMLVGTIGVVAALSQGAAPGRADSRRLVTQVEYERWQKELSNWGRWGPNDEMGTLNLITPAKRKEAAALVKEGFTVSLASDVKTQKLVDVPCPAEWKMSNANQTGAADSIAFPCIHGASSTHLDAFAHVFFGGKMWNGYPQSQFATMERGATKAAVTTMKNGIVTRGVLYDMARLKGVPYLNPGDRIFPEDLDAWEKKAGVRLTPGDAMVLHWGRWARRAKLGPYGDQAAGLDNTVIPWLKKRDISLLVWETAGYDPQPPGDLPRYSLHNFVLTMLGVHLIDRGDTEALSEAAAARNRWEFMLTVAPLPIVNGTGSPVSPIATF